MVEGALNRDGQFGLIDPDPVCTSRLNPALDDNAIRMLPEPLCNCHGPLTLPSALVRRCRCGRAIRH